MLEDSFFFFPTSDAEIPKPRPEECVKVSPDKSASMGPIKKKFYQNRNFGHIFFGLKFAIAQASGHPSEDPISMGSNP